jgi:thiosulfate dehydrogenase
MQIVSTTLRAALGVLAMAWPVVWPAMRAASAQGTPSTQQIWTVPEVGALPNNAYGRLVRRGRDLITATYTHIGPEVADRAKRFAGNNLACGNCHLQAGTKKFGIPLFGLLGEFPRHSARSGAQITIEDRLNSCMTRSMNGRAIPVGAPEMQAMVAYVKFLSTGVPPGQMLPGMGTGKMPELDRAADPARGERDSSTLASPATGPMAPAFAAACRPPISATWCRRCGATTASTTAPEWRG